MPVPRFGMVARFNGQSLVLGEGDSVENPFVLHEIIDLTVDQEEEAGPLTQTSWHQVLVDVTNDIPNEDPPAYEVHCSSVDRAI